MIFRRCFRSQVYAGAYLNEDGKLVVLIALSESSVVSSGALSSLYEDSNIKKNTESSIFLSEINAELEEPMDTSNEFKEISDKLKIVSENSDIIFQEAKYPYTYLLALMDQFNEDFTKNVGNPNSIWRKVTAFALLDDKNCISVDILELDDAKIESFRNEISDSDAIIFKNSKGFVEASIGTPTTDIATADTQTTDNSTAITRAAATNIYAGNPIMSVYSEKRGSIGYRCRRLLNNGNYEYGFVTAAHIFESVGSGAYTDSRKWIGNATKYQRGGHVDAAFFSTNPDYAMKNTTQNSQGHYLAEATFSIPSVNSTIALIGAKTVSLGGVKSIVSSWVDDDGVLLTQQLATDYLSTNGDSGGIVFIPSATSNRIVGIHVAGPKRKEDDPYWIPGTRYVTYAIQIGSVLGVYPY